VAGLCRSPRWRLITLASRCQCRRRWEAAFVVDAASNGEPTFLMASKFKLLGGLHLAYVSGRLCF
jgi:hypothetical protein